MDVAAFAAEVLEALPPEHGRYYFFCGAEADALMRLGATDRAMERYRETTDITERLAAAEPRRADYQWDLVASLQRMADLAEDGGGAHLRRALEIMRWLDDAGALYPERREWIARFEERLARL